MFWVIRSATTPASTHRTREEKRKHLIRLLCRKPSFHPRCAHVRERRASKKVHFRFRSVITSARRSRRRREGRSPTTKSMQKAHRQFERSIVLVEVWAERQSNNDNARASEQQTKQGGIASDGDACLVSPQQLLERSPVGNRKTISFGITSCTSRSRGRVAAQTRTSAPQNGSA